eukprot:gnl/MRDRNA2_/MRDRNA2_138486_c0_seq1.p1 gnl/MRDRNA2_/MRDRNA2_138486_c0~~gnl/MRDRNA2_/MRDRNA2_138486_c0_seq1.p1  ORF type:complete len:268 (+),score=38.80 gnl/MRDRNA2_/MRDRNA2_138486_c0_seq1:40-843(+)
MLVSKTELVRHSFKHGFWLILIVTNAAAEEAQQPKPAEERQKDLPGAIAFSVLGCSTMLPFAVQAARWRLCWEAVCGFFLMIVSATFYIHEARDKAYAKDWQFFAGELHYGMHWIQWQRIMSILTVTVGCSLWTLLLQNENRSVDGMLNALYSSTSIIMFERDMWNLQNTTLPFMMGLGLWVGKCVATKKRPSLHKRWFLAAMVVWIAAIIFFYISYHHEDQWYSIVRPLHHTWHSLAGFAMFFTLRAVKVEEREWYQQQCVTDTSE